MKLPYNPIKIALTCLLGVCAYVFWAVPYRSALSFQEQSQLFLTTGEYFTIHLEWPGGIATYIGEWLAQFYNNYWIGAAVMALLFVLVQRLTWRLSRRLVPKADSLTAYALSFAPALSLWLYLGDINVMPAYPVALIAALAMALEFCNTRQKASRLLYVLASIPVCYWLFGTSVYLLVVLMGIIVSLGGSRTFLKIAYWIVAPVYTVSIIMICAEWINYPIAQQFMGINYYRYPLVMSLLQIGVYLIVALTVIFSAWILRKGIGKKYSWAMILVVLIGIFAAVFKLNFDPKTYELNDYDYLVRINDWHGIIAKAEKKTPDLPMSVCALNLALGMTDQATTRAFDFYQNGEEGLLPPFKKESISSMMTAEAYFHLGLINTAQRYTFEAMEAIPNYNKSVRCIKRLAETNMIRGNYDVAKKYLSLLLNTTFYKKWAQRSLALIDNPSSIDNHPLYGQLKRRQIDDSFLFSDRELDKIIGQLFVKDPSNRLAEQYLLLYPILQRDLGKFMQYMQVVQEKHPYNPLICQQAVALSLVKAGQDIPQGIIDPYLLQQFKDFAQIWTKEGKDSPALDRYKNTAWYYLVKGN